MQLEPLHKSRIENFDEIAAFIDQYIGEGTSPAHIKALHDILRPYLSSSMGPMEEGGKTPKGIFNVLSGQKKQEGVFRFVPSNTDRQKVAMIADWLRDMSEPQLPGAVKMCSGMHIDELKTQAELTGLHIKPYQDRFPETSVTVTYDYAYLGREYTAKEKDRLFKSFFKTSPEKFKEDFLEGMPHGTKLSITIRGTLGHVNLNMSYKGDDGSFYFEREIDKKCKTVHHSGAECKGEISKQGIHKKVQRRYFDLYKKRGLKKVSITAGDVGAYVWAKLGFIPNDSQYTIEDMIKKRIDFMQNNPPPDGGECLDKGHAAVLKKALETGDPKALWFIVDQDWTYGGHKLGKLLTLSWHEFKNLEQTYLDTHEDREALPFLCEGLCWSGVLDLTDKDMKRRIKSYLSPGEEQKGQSYKLCPKNRSARL